MLCFLIIAFGTGCGALHEVTTVPAEVARAVTPGSKGKPPVDLVALQQQLLRFGDEFMAQVTVGIDQLRRGTNAADPVESLKWKILLVTEISSLVSGPNATANLLDMTVVVTVGRLGVQNYWQPVVYGESAQPMLDGFRNSETNIWKLAATVLTPPQQEEFRQSIEAWYRLSSAPGAVLVARGMGFASQIAKVNQAAQTKPGSILNLLNVDPFSGLDPATREIAETRLFAERAFYQVQKMPQLLGWQIELLTLNTLALPPVQQMVTNTTQLTASVDRFARMAEQLPAQVSAEREAIFKALQSQETQLTPLVNEVRQTLAAGAQMSTSLNTTLTTFDALMKRFGVGETNAVTPPDTNSPPFNILDYARTAAQLEGTAQKLTELLRTLDQTTGSNNLSRISAQLTPVVQQAQTGGQEIVDYAFWKAILLVVLVLLAALIYRFLSTRMAAARSK